MKTTSSTTRTELWQKLSGRKGFSLTVGMCGPDSKLALLESKSCHENPFPLFHPAREQDSRPRLPARAGVREGPAGDSFLPARLASPPLAPSLPPRQLSPQLTKPYG